MVVARVLQGVLLKRTTDEFTIRPMVFGNFVKKFSCLLNVFLLTHLVTSPTSRPFAITVSCYHSGFYPSCVCPRIGARVPMPHW